MSSYCDFDDAIVSTTGDEEKEGGDDEGDGDEVEEYDDNESQNDSDTAAEYVDGAFDDADSTDETLAKASPAVAHRLKLLMELENDMVELDKCRVTKTFSNIG